MRLLFSSASALLCAVCAHTAALAAEAQVAVVANFGQRASRAAGEGRAGAAGYALHLSHGQAGAESVRPGRVDGQGAALNAADLGKVAFANPKTAPYGAAAVQVMEKLGLTGAVLLKKGAGNEAAKALLQLLQSPSIKDLIRSYGYEL